MVYYRYMNAITKILSKLSGKNQQKKTEKYMDSQEFQDAIFKAAKEGAKDQAKFMKSVGASWD